MNWCPSSCSVKRIQTARISHWAIEKFRIDASAQDIELCWENLYEKIGNALKRIPHETSLQIIIFVNQPQIIQGT